MSKKDDLFNEDGLEDYLSIHLDFLVMDKYLLLNMSLWLMVYFCKCKFICQDAKVSVLVRMFLFFFLLIVPMGEILAPMN